MEQVSVTERLAGPELRPGGIDEDDGALKRSRALLRRIAMGEQRKLVTRISEALRDQTFALRYIPRQWIGDGTRQDEIAGAELWLGLPSRRRGLVPVAPFLRDLQRPALRVAMLQFSLDAACAEAVTWRQGWRVAVTVPARALADEAVLAAAQDALARTGLAADRLDLHIDEADLIEGGAALHYALGTWRTAGIGVTLDGFGASYGSLALLPRLPLSGLKFDRSLAHANLPEAREADATALIRASVAMAHRQGLVIVIDGVETEAELARGRQLGIDIAQGSWIGPAMAGDVFRARGRPM